MSLGGAGTERVKIAYITRRYFIVTVDIFHSDSSSACSSTTTFIPVEFAKHFDKCVVFRWGFVSYQQRVSFFHVSQKFHCFLIIAILSLVSFFKLDRLRNRWKVLHAFIGQSLSVECS